LAPNRVGQHRHGLFEGAFLAFQNGDVRALLPRSAQPSHQPSELILEGGMDSVARCAGVYTENFVEALSHES
jgi:hypothetical protein